MPTPQTAAIWYLLAALASLQNEQSETVFTYKATPRERVISEKTADTVAEILEAGVSGDGGAKNAYTEGYRVAAKTGTSEKFEILDANGNSYLRIGSCVAFAPYEDAEIAVIIVVDEPTCANKYGSMTAAPYISKYLSEVLPYLGIQKEKADEDIKTANYIGTPIAKAKSAVLLAGLTAEVIGEGSTVLSQSPPAGTILEKGHGKIILYTEASIIYGTVPNGKGKNLAEALTLFTNAGFNVHLKGAEGGGMQTDAVVVSQSIPAGGKAERGTCITLEIYHPNDTD